MDSGVPVNKGWSFEGLIRKSGARVRGVVWGTGKTHKTGGSAGMGPRGEPTCHQPFVSLYLSQTDM